MWVARGGVCHRAAWGGLALTLMMQAKGLSPFRVHSRVDVHSLLVRGVVSHRASMNVGRCCAWICHSAVCIRAGVRVCASGIVVDDGAKYFLNLSSTTTFKVARFEFYSEYEL